MQFSMRCSPAKPVSIMQEDKGITTYMLVGQRADQLRLAECKLRLALGHLQRLRELCLLQAELRMQTKGWQNCMTVQTDIHGGRTFAYLGSD